jgi:hypothetical protein
MQFMYLLSIYFSRHNAKSNRNEKGILYGGFVGIYRLGM